jgi:hypothetical protein
MSPLGLLICTRCFGLTSAGWGMQQCRREKYQPYPGVDCPATTRSVDAFKGYLRVDSFEELGDLSGTSADGS